LSDEACYSLNTRYACGTKRGTHCSFIVPITSYFTAWTEEMRKRDPKGLAKAKKKNDKR